MGASTRVRIDQTNVIDVMQKLGTSRRVRYRSANVRSAVSMINTLITIGKIPLSGLYPKSPKVDLNKVIFNGLSIKGIYGHEMYDTWCKMLAMFDAGSDVSPIISHRLDINDSAKGIEVLLSVEVNKVVFAVGE